MSQTNIIPLVLTVDEVADGLHPNFPPFISRDRRLMGPPGAVLVHVV